MAVAFGAPSKLAHLTACPKEGTRSIVQPHDDILTVSEVAKDLRCSKAHVYKAINGAVPGVTPLPAILLGRRRLVRRSTLERWKQANERSATGPAILIASPRIQAVDA